MLPLFDASTLLKHIPEMDFSAHCPLSPETMQYARYYGLNFADSHPDVQHNLGFFQVLGGKIIVHTYLPVTAKGTVFLFHGYYDHSGLYKHLINHVLGLGFAVLIYDLPGHGLSTGPRAVIDDFNDYLETLTVCLQLAKGHLPSPWHAIAQSTGGAILMDYLLSLAENDLPNAFDQTLLLAPLFHPYEWRKNRLTYYLMRLFTQKVKRGFGASSHDAAFIDFVRYHDPLQSPHLSVSWVGALNQWIKKMENKPPSTFSPCVIQGTQDKTVDAETNIAFIQNKFHQPSVYYVQGARHHLVNESIVYREEVFRLISEKLIRK